MPNNRPIRVVMVLNKYMPETFGGSEQQARKLAHALCRLGLAITVLAPRLKAETKARENDGPVAIRRFRVFLTPDLGGPFGLAFLLWSLQVCAWFIFNRSRYDLIHVMHGQARSVPAVLAGALAAKPVLVKIGTGGRQFDLALVKTTRMYGALFAWAITRFATAYVATSRVIVQDLKTFGIADEKCFLIPNGVALPQNDKDSRVTRPPGRSSMQLLYFGRIDRHKAIDTMVRGFARLDRDTDVRLRIVGDGSSLPATRALAAELGILRRVAFEPPVTDVGSLLGDADFHVSTSLFEGMSNALLESMAHGVPGIVSRVSGVDDLVVDGVSGFIFEPGDEEDYVRALKRAVSLPLEARRAMARRAMTIVGETCAIDRIATLHAAVYRKLLAGGSETSIGDLPLPGTQAPIAGAQ